jgi:hypothetical protein
MGKGSRKGAGRGPRSGSRSPVSSFGGPPTSGDVASQDNLMDRWRSEDFGQLLEAGASRPIAAPPPVVSSALTATKRARQRKAKRVSLAEAEPAPDVEDGGSADGEEESVATGTPAGVLRAASEALSSVVETILADVALVGLLVTFVLDGLNT